jgi:hypothetical protein
VLATALLLAYVRLLSRLEAADECGCFGSMSHATVAQARVRNVLLALTTVIGAALVQVRGAGWSTGAALGAGLLLLSAVGAHEVQLRMFAAGGSQGKSRDRPHNQGIFRDQ